MSGRLDCPISSSPPENSPAERAISAQLMSVQGPLARTVGDLRLALAAMAGTIVVRSDRSDLARLADLRHPMSVDLWIAKAAAKAKSVGLAGTVLAL